MSKEIPANLEGEIEENNEKRENGKKPLESKKTPDSIEQYNDSLNRGNELEERILNITEQTREDHADIDKLRETMGLPPDLKLKTATDQYVEGLKSQELAAEQQIKKAEKTLLGAPEGEGDNQESLNKQIEALAEKGKDDTEQMEKKAREKFVQEFVESAIKKMMDDFERFLDESENTDPARQLIQQKTTTEVQNKAQKFIEDGGEPDFGFEAEIKGAEFDSPKGEKVKYVTEFNITFEGVSSTDKSAEDEGDLLDPQAQKKMQEAEEQGGLEETKEKAA